MNESDTDANTKAIDSLLNYETVKYFGAEAREAQRYDRSMARYEAMSTKTYVSLTVLNAGQAVIFTAGLTGIMMMAVAGIRSGHHSVGDFVLVNAMMIQLYQPLNFMGMVYREVKQATIDIEMMFDILGQNAEIADKPGARPLAVGQGVVRFENVRFAYDGRRQILHDVSFEIPAGKTVAVVGPSGAGKSTLSRLLFRFYEPASGRITIDGQDIGAVTQTSLRDSIGMVPQDTVLFNDSIAYNIRYGRWSASDAEVKEAARLAQIDQFIAVAPGGYGAQVGERGLKLSGGEKQRVAIARTILKAPPVLILDEATSALDTFTEREIQASLGAGLARTHDAGHRPPALDDRRCRRNPGARRGPHRRARHPRRPAATGRRLCRDVGPATPGGRGRGDVAPRAGTRRGRARRAGGGAGNHGSRRG